MQISNLVILFCLTVIKAIENFEQMGKRGVQATKDEWRHTKEELDNVKKVIKKGKKWFCNWLLESIFEFLVSFCK